MAVMRTSRRLRQERSVDDVTPGQYSVLACLDVHGPQTPRELADREKVQPPSMTRTIAALEQLGLVGRTAHPSDGRQVLVEPDRRRARPSSARRAGGGTPGWPSGWPRPPPPSARCWPRPPTILDAAGRLVSPTFRSLRTFNYRVWATGAIVSNVGTWMQRVAQDWLVLTVLTDDSAVAVGITTGLQFAPMLLLAPSPGCSPTGCPSARLLIATQAAMGLVGLVAGRARGHRTQSSSGTSTSSPSRSASPPPMDRPPGRRSSARWCRARTCPTRWA